MNEASKEDRYRKVWPVVLLLVSKVKNRNIPWDKRREEGSRMMDKRNQDDGS